MSSLDKGHSLTELTGRCAPVNSGNSHLHTPAGRRALQGSVSLGGGDRSAPPHARALSGRNGLCRGSALLCLLSAFLSSSCPLSFFFPYTHLSSCPFPFPPFPASLPLCLLCFLAIFEYGLSPPKLRLVVQLQVNPLD